MKRKDDLYMREQLRRACRLHKTHEDMIHDTASLNCSIKYFKSMYTVDAYKNADIEGDIEFMISAIHKALDSIKKHGTKINNTTIGWVLYVGITHIMDELDSALDVHK